MAVIGGYFHGTPGTYSNGDYVDAAEFDNRGNLLVNIAAGEVISATVNAGTINAGTINASTINTATINAGTLGTVSNIGQIHNAGTIAGGTLGVVSNLTQGSINVTAGTIGAATINTGTINLATIVGPTAVGAATTSNPIFVGGMDTGGTFSPFILESAGNPNLRVGLYSAGTQIQIVSPQVDGQGTGIASLNVHALPSIFNGATYDRLRSVNTANSGTGMGVLASGILGADTGGTYHRIITDTGGTIALPNIPGGSIAITAGTIGAATVNAGTINAGTVAISGTSLVAVHTGSGNGLRANSVGAVNIGVWGNALALGDGETNSPFLVYNTDNNTAESKRTYPMTFNGITWDRNRNNSGVTEGTVIASTASGVSFNSSDKTNYNWRGAQFFWAITASSGTATFDLAIQAKDPVSGGYLTITGGTFPSQSTVGTVGLTIYPGITANAGTTINQVIPRTYRAAVTVTNDGTFTSSLGVAYIV